jgi:hypothetical protein
VSGKARRRHGTWVLFAILVVMSLRARAARAQGPAPETAPPLFPGGGLVSYSSAFTTRTAMPGIIPGEIPVTGRPTFSHEADFNFTWGFYRDFDWTIIIPVVSNHFDAAGAPVAHGTGLGDLMLLVKYPILSARFQPRDDAGILHNWPEASYRANRLDRRGGKTFSCGTPTRFRVH